jgi:hypothetical protein
MSFVRYLPFTALVIFISVRALKRGFWPGSTDSKHWNDRAINATGGILILAFWAFLLFAFFWDRILAIADRESSF